MIEPHHPWYYNTAAHQPAPRSLSGRTRMCSSSRISCRQSSALSYISEFARSSKKGSSATRETQTKVRTSTSVIYGVEAESPLLRHVRSRIAEVASVDVAQLQATKISCYEKGQFFDKHTDAPAGVYKKEWTQRLLNGKETNEQLTAEGEACFLPDRFCTVWIYLNAVTSQRG